MKALIPCALSLLSMHFALAQPGQAHLDGISRKFLDLPYAAESKAQVLDIFLPSEGEGPFPLIVYIHGGAFKFGDKRSSMLDHVLIGLERGYAVASINYRLSGEAKWPAQIFDCKAAIRWLRAHSRKYMIDSGHVAVWGESAGGHLSAMLGTTGDVSVLEDHSQGYAEYSSRVQAVVDWFGPTDFLKMDEQLAQSRVLEPMIHSVPNSPESELLGGNLEDIPERVREADPTTWVTGDDSPFFIQHGTEDNLVPYQGSVELARVLGREVGSEQVHLELFPDTGHGNGPAFYSEENIDRIFAFLDRHLK